MALKFVYGAPPTPYSHATSIASTHLSAIAPFAPPPSPSFITTADKLNRTYKQLRVLGEGTYGVVYDAIHRPTGVRVALKRIRIDDNEDVMNQLGIPTTAIREVALLRRLRHKNIVSLLDIAIVGPQLWITFELCHFDLRQYMKLRQQQLQRYPQRLPFVEGTRTVTGVQPPFLPLNQIKHLVRQFLAAVDYCHDAQILHRDLKPQNLLLDSTGWSLKVADFGLARTLPPPNKRQTAEVVTLWYRSPELLLGDKHYTAALDMWCVGCIVVEMIIGRPLFQGDSEIDTVYKIFRLLGTPVDLLTSDCKDGPAHGESAQDHRRTHSKNDSHDLDGHLPGGSTTEHCNVSPLNSDGFPIWKGVTMLPLYQQSFPKWRSSFSTFLRFILGEEDPMGIDFIARLLRYDPWTRSNAREALQHPWLAAA